MALSKNIFVASSNFPPPIDVAAAASAFSSATAASVSFASAASVSFVSAASVSFVSAASVSFASAASVSFASAAFILILSSFNNPYCCVTSQFFFLFVSLFLIISVSNTDTC